MSLLKKYNLNATRKSIVAAAGQGAIGGVAAFLTALVLVSSVRDGWPMYFVQFIVTGACLVALMEWLGMQPKKR